MRMRMVRRMMHHQMRHGPGMWGPCGPGMWGPERSGWSEEDRLAMLEEYQRDLEQEVEDVAERIRRLKEDRANA